MFFAQSNLTRMLFCINARIQHIHEVSTFLYLYMLCTAHIYK